MADQILGTDYSTILQTKKQGGLFHDLPQRNDLGLLTFLAQIAAWVVTRLLSFVSFFLNLLLGFEKVLINLRVDTLQMFYWGRGNTFALFAQAIFLFVVLAIGFTWLVSQGLTPSVVQEYVPENATVYASGTQVDVFTESGSLLTALPKELKRLDTETYTVSYGDTIGGDTLKNIGTDWEISADSIRWANNFSKNYQPKVGTVIKIPPLSGSIYTVVAGDTPESIAARFKISQITLLEVNFIEPGAKLKKGQDIFIPGAGPQAAKPVAKKVTIISRNNRAIRRAVQAPAGPRFLSWPVQGGNGGTVTPGRCFEYGHEGIDINALGTGKSNPVIVAAAPGIVRYAGFHCGGDFRCGFAWMVEIDHVGFGFSTIYGHLKGVPSVKAGDNVARGQPIGIMGASGNAYGVHLHFQVNKTGTYPSGFITRSNVYPVDPARYMFDARSCD